MTGRLPTAEDFPPHLTLTITPPPQQHSPVNVLILLHGLGDTDSSFAKFAAQLSLPETCCISLRAPTPLPFELGGFHWGDDIVFDPATGAMEFDTGFSKAMGVLGHTIIKEGLMKECGYQSRDIMVFGFGQGGMAAIAVTASLIEELGGAISIGGPPPASIASFPEKRKTPILVLGGSSKTLVNRSVIDSLKKQFQGMDYHKWSKAGDGMPSNREEMLPIMRFFARRLRSRKGVPSGSIELG